MLIITDVVESEEAWKAAAVWCTEWSAAHVAKLTAVSKPRDSRLRLDKIPLGKNIQIHLGWGLRRR